MNNVQDQDKSIIEVKKSFKSLTIKHIRSIWSVNHICYKFTMQLPVFFMCLIWFRKSVDLAMFGNNPILLSLCMHYLHQAWLLPKRIPPLQIRGFNVGIIFAELILVLRTSILLKTFPKKARKWFFIVNNL